jgi:hypothetical protein
MPASMRSRGMLGTRMLSVLLLATACNAGGSAADGAGKAGEQGKEAPKAEAKADAEAEQKAERLANGKAGAEVKVDPPTTAGFGKIEPPPEEPVADVLVAGKRQAAVKVGQTLAETVSNPRNPVDGSSWSAEPKITGTAVKFLERAVESPPPDVDGGSHTFHYRFEAVAAGRAEVSFALTSPESKEPIEEVRFTVVVTEG